ncbi:MAG: YbjQ family protein [Pseudomonadota bacterium]
MADCRQCNKQLSFVERLSGICGDCLEVNHRASLASGKADLTDQLTNAEAAAAIILTTESSPNLDISERLEIITAECVLGMNIFKDIGSSLRDLVGGRNEAYQKALKDARKAVLLDLKREAHAIGADAVVAVDLDYSEISGGGKSMLFLVASGTAVRIATKEAATS